MVITGKFKFSLLFSSLLFLYFLGSNICFAETFYSTNDGSVENSDSTWSTMRNASSGSVLCNTSECWLAVGFDGGVYHLNRGFLSFDIDIPEGKQVASSTLHLWSQYGWSEYTAVVLGTQSSSLTTDDYDQCGDDLLTDSILVADGDYNTYTFSDVSGFVDGLNTFCIRNVDHDLNDISKDSSGTGFLFRTSSYADTDYDPYIIVNFEDIPEGTTTPTTTPSNADQEFLGSFYRFLFTVLMGFAILSLGGFTLKFLFNYWK